MMKEEYKYKDDEFMDDEIVEDDDESCLKLFHGKDVPTPGCAWDFYQEGLRFNDSIGLEENVKLNENMYIGKQWEGVETNGLPTPIINILKRVVGFTTASITTDNVRVTASALSNTAGTEQYKPIIKAVNDEFEAIVEKNHITFQIREFARRASIDGDSCLYVYWDEKKATGQKFGKAEVKGGISVEQVDNTRVFFGNPSDSRVQKQPYIQILKREMVRNVRIEAKNNGQKNWRRIVSDEEVSNRVDSAKHVDNMCSVLMTFWRDEETDEIWCYESTQTCTVKEPWNLGIKLYPFVWLSWDEITDCYHGQAMLTGLIPNQVFINKAYAMSMLSIMRAGFSKVLYDQTRIKRWDNRVGGAIGINGGDVNTVARVIDPAPISPQIYQYIQAAIEDTEKSLGATSVALGDTRPDNTSAIIALQRAAATPSENTKQRIYEASEDLFRICLEFMGEYYGKRYVDMPTPQKVQDAVQFAQGANPELEIPDEIPVEFDFKILKEHPVIIKLDAGASAYYSEIAARSTLDNLLMNGQIDIIDYLERIPDDYIPGREALIAKKKKEKQQQEQMQMMMSGMAPPSTPSPGGGKSAPPTSLDEMQVAGGGGYGGLQRAINSGAA